MNAFLRNVLSNWTLLGASIVVGFVLMPVLLHRLGEEAYGVVVLVNVMAGYSTLLRAGLGGAVVQRVARARGRSDAAAASASVSGVASMYLLLGGLATVAGAIVAWGMPAWFHLAPELVTPARGLTLFTALLLAIQFPGSVYGGILQGLERYDLANVAVGTGLVVRTAGLLALVHEPGDLVLFGAIQFVTSSLEIAIAAVLARRSWPELRLRWSSPREAAARDAGRFGLGNLVLNLSEKIVHDTDPLVVGAVLGTGPVAVYNGGGTLTRYTRMVLTELTRVLGPTISRQHAEGDVAGERATFLRMTRMALLLALPMSALGWALGPSFVVRWLGEGFEEAGSVLRVLLVAQLLSAAQAVAVSALWGRGRLRLPAIVHGLQAVMNLALSLWWVRHWGLVGVAYGTLVPVILLDLWWLPGVALRALGLGWGEYLREAVLRPLLLLLAVLPLAAWIEGRVVAAWPSLVLWAAVGAVVYLLLAWWLGLRGDERAHLRRRVGPA